PCPLALLRPRRERPRSRGAEQRDERAPPHVGHGLPPFPLCAGVTGWKIIPPLRPDMIVHTCHCRCILVLLLSQWGERPDPCRSFLCALPNPRSRTLETGS